MSVLIPDFECRLPYWLQHIGLPRPAPPAAHPGCGCSSPALTSLPLWLKLGFISKAPAPARLSEPACLPRESRSDPPAYAGHAGAPVAIRLTFKWKMSFSKAVDVQWSAVHEHLTSPGVSASVSVLCELGAREKSVQDGGVEGLYFCSDCTAVGLGSNRKSTWGHLI